MTFRSKLAKFLPINNAPITFGLAKFHFSNLEVSDIHSNRDLIFVGVANECRSKYTQVNFVVATWLLPSNFQPSATDN
jgi:hypothetical protein